MTVRTLPRSGTTGSLARPLGFAVAAALVLGVTAVAADHVDGTLGRILQLIFGSGLAWLLAVISGGLARRWYAAACAGIVMLTGAVAVYYFVILVFDTRPGAELGFGMILWGVLGIVGGAGAGLLGWVISTASPLPRTLAIGSAGGAVASEGFATVMTESQLDPALLAVSFGVPLLAILILVRDRRLLGALALAVVVGVVGGIAWTMVDSLV